MSFNINIYATSLGNNFTETRFIKNCIKMTTSVRFLFPCDYIQLQRTDPRMETFFLGFNN